MAAQQKKGRVVAEQIAAEVEQKGQVGLDFKHLALFAAPERGRIENDAVITSSAFDFAAQEGDGIIHDPADGCVLQLIERGVFTRPFHHAFGGVEVADLRTALRGGEGRTAGIGEEVEHAGRFVPHLALLNRFADPVPHDALFREHTEVAEIGGGEFKADARDGDNPFIGQVVAVVPAVAVLAVEAGRHILPVFFGTRLMPDGLSGGPHQRYLAEAFQLAASAAVHQFVIILHWLTTLSERLFPGIGNLVSNLWKKGSVFFQTLETTAFQ